MKKTLFAALAAAAALLIPAGIQAQQKVVEPNQKYDIFQIGMLKSSPATQDTAEVYGLRFGLPICGGKAEVEGVDFAILASYSDLVYGFQYATAYTVSEGEFYGVKIACVNISKKVSGAEIGAINISQNASAQFGVYNQAESGLQFGIINVMTNGFLPCMILFNFSI